MKGILMFTFHKNTTQSMKTEKKVLCWWWCHQGYPGFGLKVPDPLEKASFRNCGERGVWKMWAFNRQKGWFGISDLIPDSGSILCPSVCPAAWVIQGNSKGYTASNNQEDKSSCGIWKVLVLSHFTVNVRNGTFSLKLVDFVSRMNNKDVSLQYLHIPQAPLLIPY